MILMELVLLCESVFGDRGKERGSGGKVGMGFLEGRRDFTSVFLKKVCSLGFALVFGFSLGRWSTLT